MTDTPSRFAAFRPTPDGFEATVARFPDVIGRGETVDEAYEDLARQVEPLIIAAA